MVNALASIEEESSLPRDECKQQVRNMAKLFALLYYHFAKVSVEKLGDEEGKKLIAEAIRRFGAERGREVRERVEAKGLELTPENFKRFSDLPSLGWERDETEITYCPYAEVWKEKEAEELGILYCEVDVHKYESFNPRIEVKRLKSVLKGQDCCQYDIGLR